MDWLGTIAGGALDLADDFHYGEGERREDDLKADYLDVEQEKIGLGYANLETQQQIAAMQANRMDWTPVLLIGGLGVAAFALSK